MGDNKVGSNGWSTRRGSHHVPKLTPEQVKRNQTLANRSWYDRVRASLIKQFGGKCARCRVRDVRVLQFDHKRGYDGDFSPTDYTRIGPYRRLLYVRKHPKKFQLLCANHNWIKRAENREYTRRKV